MSEQQIRVTGLWRFPVKSMVGESMSELEVTRRGVHADRLWAVHDVERNATISARRQPRLLQLRASYDGTPPPAAGPGRTHPVIITDPTGAQHHSDDPAIHQVLSEFLDRDVRLVGLPDDPRSHRLPWRERLTSLTPRALARDLGIERDESLPKISDMDPRALMSLARNATPPGTFVDLCPVHLVTEASLATIADALGEADVDARRFRPNIVLGGAPTGLPEASWAGADGTIGTAQVHFVMPTVRCVVPSREQGDLPLDKRLTRAVASTADRYLGVYADVTGPGVIRSGDPLSLSTPTPPGPLRRLAGSAGDAVLDAFNRVAELGR